MLLIASFVEWFHIQILVGTRTGTVRGAARECQCPPDRPSERALSSNGALRAQGDEDGALRISHQLQQLLPRDHYLQVNDCVCVCVSSCTEPSLRIIWAEAKPLLAFGQ